MCVSVCVCVCVCVRVVCGGATMMIFKCTVVVYVVTVFCPHIKLGSCILRFGQGTGKSQLLHSSGFCSACFHIIVGFGGLASSLVCDFAVA